MTTTTNHTECHFCAAPAVGERRDAPMCQTCMSSETQSAAVNEWMTRYRDAMMAAGVDAFSASTMAADAALQSVEMMSPNPAEWESPEELAALDASYAADDPDSDILSGPAQ